MKPEVIYIATRLSPRTEGAHAAIDYLVNVKQSLKAAAEVWRRGHYPYVPGLDFMLYLELDGDYGVGEKMPYEFGLEMVRRCDSILIHNGLHDSTGVKSELGVAFLNDKKVYYSLDDIDEYVEGK